MKAKSFSVTKAKAGHGLGLAFIPVLLLLTLLLPAGPAGAAPDQVRPSILAGTWYPGEASALQKQVRDFLSQADPPQSPGRLVALVVPHAGYVYSGPVAAYGYALLKKQQFKTVILVGPSHRTAFSGVSVDLRNYETPLGRVAVDQDLARKLMDHGAGLIATLPEAHDQEHCLEIQLPFLQETLGRFEIVPLVMGSHDLDTCRKLAETLTHAGLGNDVLLLVSTDLSHFHTGDQARAMDAGLLKKVSDYDPEGLHQDLAAGRVEACGGSALVTVMMAARELGADRATVLKYAHSGDATGDNSKVVGYLAAALTASGPAPSASRKKNNHDEIGPKDRKRLLALARESILAGLDGRELAVPADLPQSLQLPRGAFVTLKRHGELRGCIGRLVADSLLPEVVVAMARAAAFEDPRFPPLTKNEYSGLTVEISVLTPFEPVRDVNDIQVGVHGLVMSQGFYRGLLLPQVPVEQGWNRDEFLDQTCGKAGLPFGCWKDPATEILSFRAEVFGEGE
jgi:hypothetical protein